MSAQSVKLDPTDIDSRTRLIEGLILDEFTHLWVSDEFISPIVSVLNQLPTKDLEALADTDFVFLAPSNILGLVFTWQRKVEVGQRVVYLSPALLSLPTTDLRAMVAHELAHVLLKHDDAPSSQAAKVAEQGENEADEMVKRWGFTIPNSFKR
jgi:hypothetical protein